MAAPLQVELSYKQIWKIALPISLALLIPQLNLIINSIFLGHHSQTSLAIASITGVYYLIFAGIGYGLNNGLQAMISRRAGENRPEAIGQVFSQGVLIALSIALAGILFTFAVTPALLRYYLEADQAAPAIEFLKIRILGLPFLYIYQMRNALLVGINQSRYLVAGTLAETVANVFFDYVFIFGAWGFPNLGFNGAAVASIIAEFTGMFVIYLVIQKAGIGQQFALLRSLKLDGPIIRRILDISGPLVFQHAISVIAWFFFYILVARNSNQTGLAISTTIRTIFGFFGVTCWAFASTANSMVSNAIGQDRKEEVLGLVFKIMRLSLSIALLVCLLLNIFPGTYLRLFGQTGAFIDEGIPVVRVVACALLLCAISTVWLNAVTGTGNSRFTFLIELGAIVVYCAYVYYVLEVAQLGILWGWMAELIYWGLLFVLSFWYMRKGNWRARKL